MYDVVLVGGVERMTKLPTAQVTDTLGSAADTLYEIPAGFTFPGFYAAIATAYMHRYGMKPEHLMNVAIKNHQNGALNPKAQFGVTIPDWMQGRIAAAIKKGKPAPTWRDQWDFLHDDAANPMVAWPLRLFDCSPVTDGAACVLLVSGERAREFTDNPVYVIGAGQASDAPLHDRADLTTLNAARGAAAQAYAQAGVTAERYPHRRSARLLHHRRSRRQRRPRLLRTRHGLQGRRGWHDRPRRRAAHQHLRRPEVEGASGRRIGRGASGRSLQADARRSRRPAGEG